LARDHDAETVKCAHGGLRRLRLDFVFAWLIAATSLRHAILDAPGVGEPPAIACAL